MAIARKLAGLAGLTAAVYALVLRPRMDCWGATNEEVEDTYPGRELIPDGVRSSTLAVTIEAPPASVWPWLVQMGYDRAGWYWQDLSAGDYLWAGSPAGPMYPWQVAALEPGRFFGLRGLTDLHVRRLDPAQPRPSAYIDGLWGFLLKELPGDRTRLVQSGYQSIRPRWLERLINFWIHPPVHWTGQTRQFANLKRNIESAGRRQPQSHKR